MFVLSADDRISLTKVELRDAEELFALTDASRAYLREWLSWVDATKSAEDTRGFIQASLEQHARNDGFQCCIWYEGGLAGMIGLLHINWANRKTAIGYWLGPEFQGNGIMTRCCQKLIGHAFEELDLNRVEIRAAAENKRSRAIPERLGFVEEGIIREAEWLYDHFVDHVIYGLIRREWS